MRVLYLEPAAKQFEYLRVFFFVAIYFIPMHLFMAYGRFFYKKSFRKLMWSKIPYSFSCINVCFMSSLFTVLPFFDCISKWVKFSFESFLLKSFNPQCLLLSLAVTLIVMSFCCPYHTRYIPREPQRYH